MIALDCENGPILIADRSVENVATEEARAASALTAQDSDHARNYLTLITAQQQVRNQPNGNWVAQINPNAVKHAQTWVIAAVEVHQALILSDGAARRVIDFKQHDWPYLFSIAERGGPEGIIGAARELERSDPRGLRWPRYKVFDDATAIVCIPS